MKTTVFVGREPLLHDLTTLFEETKKGLGKVILLSGEAGSGKTSLVRQFVSRIETDKTIISAIVECVDKEGLNSYSPFKELLLQLNATALASNNLSKNEAMKKLKGFITEAGTQWIGTIPVIGGVIAAGINTFQAYQNHYKKNENQPKTESEADVFRIFEMEFRRLAQNHTLIVVLDDLQWADSMSLNLLFMLGKAIRQNSFPIMLIGTYRPSDVNAGRNKILETGKNISVRHPLQDKINELRNYTKLEAHISRNDKWLNELSVPSLSAIDINGILNRMFPANKFPTDFHSKLLELTGGHALFVTEVIFSLLQKEAIYKDANNNFLLKNSQLVELPTSIVGVIGERIERLSSELKKVLDYASVNGEDFSIQIIEKILKIDELDLLDYIEELAKKHGLLVSSDTEKIKDILFDLYHFTNKLIHKYVYENLEGARRRALHRKVAETIKNIFGDELETNNELKDKYLRHLQIGQGLIDGVTFQLTNNAEKEQESDRNQILIAADNEVKSAFQEFEQYAMNECIARADKALAFVTTSLFENEDAKKIRLKALTAKMKAQNWLGFYKDAFDTALKMRIVAEEINNEVEIASTFNHLGINAFRLGNYDNAIEFHQKSLNFAAQLKNNELVADNLDNIGECFDSKAMYDKAIECYKKALEINIQLDNKQAQTENYLNIGSAFRKKGEYDTALHFYDMALELAEIYADKRTISTLINNKGLCINSKGNYAEAIPFFEKALQIDIQINDRVNMANHLNNIGLAKELQGDYDNAIVFYLKTLAIDESLDDRVKMATSYNNIGSVYREQGNYTKALEFMEKALELNRMLNDKVAMSFTYCNLGNTYFYKGDHSIALRYYKSGLEIDMEVNDKMNIANALNNIGNVLFSKEDYYEAEQKFTQALEILTALNDRLSMASCLNNLGNLQYNLKDYDKALLYYMQAISLNSETSDVLALSLNYNNIANVYDQLGDFDKAIEYYKKSVDTDIQINNKVQLAMHANNLGITFQKKSHYKEAAHYFRIAVEQYVAIDNKEKIADCSENLADVLVYLTETEPKAEKQAIELYMKAKNLFLAENQIVAYRRSAKSLARLFEKTEQFRRATGVYEELIKNCLQYYDHEEAAELYNILGICYLNLDDNDKALEAFSNAVQYAEEDNIYLSYYYSNVALVKHYKKDYIGAVDNYKAALRYCEDNEDKSEAADISLRIARSYFLMNDVENSVKNFDNAIYFYDTMGDKQNILAVLLEVAEIFRENKLFDEAIVMYNKVLEVSEKDSDFLNETLLCYFNIANCFFLKKDYPQAIDYYKVLVAEYSKINDSENVAIHHFNCGLCYQFLQNFKAAIDAFQQALGLFEELEQLENMSSCHYKIGVSYYYLNLRPLAIQELTKAKHIELQLGNNVSSIIQDIEQMKD